MLTIDLIVFKYLPIKKLITRLPRHYVVDSPECVGAAVGAGGWTAPPPPLLPPPPVFSPVCK